MTRPIRILFENAFYHITSRGERKENIFRVDWDKRIFLKKLNETFAKYNFICYSYCLMDNHYHLFLKTVLPNLSEGIHYLNSSYSNWIKEKYKIVGSVFQGRFKSILVDKDNYALHVSAYIHLNPLRAGIVKDLKDYKWSSYLDFIQVRKPMVSRIDPEFILAQISYNMDKAREEYVNYIYRNIEMKSPVINSYKGVAIGNDRFIQKVKAKIDKIGLKREINVTRNETSHTTEEIINAIIKVCKIEKDRIFQKDRYNVYRQLAIHLIKGNTSYSLKEIGKMFKMDYAAISMANSRFEKKMKKDKKIERVRNKVIDSLYS